MLTVKGARFTYPGGPEFVFSLTIERGEIVTLSGPSGSGKSTLIDLICGFLAPLSGDILWDGQSILSLTPAKRPVSALFQTGDLFDHLDVETNIALGLDPRGRPNPVQQAQIRSVLQEIGLPDFERRLPGQLSGGQRQRVALARDLLRDKPLMLLDEPFSALDTETRDEMARLVRRLTRDRGLATLVVSHDPTDAQRLGSRAVELRDGKITLSAQGRAGDQV
ncbi:MAG TPA: ATP-binding cassette domain-containing protein [Thermohalobaculum sp.]|nr:ATP-binding cassette domain-containing protein [Thermohalobaculum sp.]